MDKYMFSNDGRPKLIITKQPEVFCPLCRAELVDVIMERTLKSGRSHPFTGIKKCKTCDLLFSYAANLRGGNKHYFDIGNSSQMLEYKSKRRRQKKKNVSYFKDSYVDKNKKKNTEKEVNYLNEPIKNSSPKYEHAGLTESEHKYSHTSLEESFIKINLDNLKH